MDIEAIRKDSDSVNWSNISIDQKLSEDFIREFKDRVYWYSISEQRSAITLAFDMLAGGIYERNKS